MCLCRTLGGSFPYIRFRQAIDHLSNAHLGMQRGISSFRKILYSRPAISVRLQNSSGYAGVCRSRYEDELL